MKIMIGGTYTQSALVKLIEEKDLNYRNLYTKCSMMLEKLADKSLEQNLLQGIGFASKKAGQLIGSIPLVKEGPVDEFLQEGGAKLNKSASKMVESTLAAFAEMSNPRIGVFTDKMDDMIQIYTPPRSYLL